MSREESLRRRLFEKSYCPIMRQVVFRPPLQPRYGGVISPMTPEWLRQHLYKKQAQFAENVGKRFRENRRH